MRIWTRSGWANIKSVKETGRIETVYNFEVESYHTYFVGDSEIWAHNTCFPDAKEMAKIFNTSKSGWHKRLKPDILKDASEFAKKIPGTNPDIGINKAGNIVLRSRVDSSKSVVTDLLADWYKQ